MRAPGGRGRRARGRCARGRAHLLARGGLALGGAGEVELLAPVGHEEDRGGDEEGASPDRPSEARLRRCGLAFRKDQDSEKSAVTEGSNKLSFFGFSFGGGVCFLFSRV